MTRTVLLAVTLLAVPGHVRAAATPVQDEAAVLLAAAANGRADLVQPLLDGGVDPNVRGEDGVTALMLAAWAGHVDVVRLLLANGADPNAKNQSFGGTALIGASLSGHIDVVKVLLDYGADVRATAIGGVTAVRLAAAQGHSDIIDVLVQHGAAVTEAEVYRVIMGDQFVLPAAKNIDNRGNEEDDVILGIDRNASYYLDNGDGDMRQIPNDSLASFLNQVYSDRERDRILYFVADPNIEYRAIDGVLDIAREAGVRVLAAIAEREGEAIALSRAVMDVQIWFEGLEQLASGNQIVLQLLTDGSYAINQEPVRLSQLDSGIHSIFDNRPQKLMFVEAAGNRRYQDAITAMDIARGAGVQVIFIAPVEVPEGIPPIDLLQRFDPRDYSGVRVEGVEGAVDLSQVFAEAVVDEVPERLSCPPVTYPPTLHQANIQGQVLLQFVVETDGRVKPETIDILRSTHQPFEAPAKSMIAGCLFRPGRVLRQAVRVLVQMPILLEQSLLQIGLFHQ